MTEMTDTPTTGMAGVMDTGATVLWMPREPFLMGNPELVAKIRTYLFLTESRSESIAVTPTGPFVAPTITDREAVFGAGNAVTNYGITWTNPPDVTYGAPSDAIY